MPTETLDTALVQYEPIKADIAKLKKENATLVFDYESAKGNKLARSHVAQLRTLKGEIERKRVALTMKMHERIEKGPERGAPAPGRGAPGRGNDARGGNRERFQAPPRRPEPEPINPLAAQLAKLKGRLN